MYAAKKDKEKLADYKVRKQYVTSAENISDVLTKNLRARTHKEFVKRMGLKQKLDVHWSD